MAEPAASAGSRRGSFWIGTERVAGEVGSVCRGPMFVQWEAPAETSRPYPVVLVHGGGGQGTDYLDTPDGRPGWAAMLVEQGFEVYVVDRPGHGRSPLHPAVLGDIGPAFPFEAAVALFRPPAEGPGSHPTSHLHTQWPGTGGDDDPVLAQFVAGTGPLLKDFAAAHALEGRRGAELLDRIGPAILVSHSAGGPTGWMTSDARPDLVKAHVAIESLGPPFMTDPALGVSLEWGLTAAPLTYDPAVSEPAELGPVARPGGDPEVPPVMLQTEPARRLANLARVPVAVLTAEASPFSQFDGHLVAFLEQAGCAVDQVRLADRGVHGNGHGMMFELNNREVLDVVVDWISSLDLG